MLRRPEKTELQDELEKELIQATECLIRKAEYSYLHQIKKKLKKTKPGT